MCIIISLLFDVALELAVDGVDALAFLEGNSHFMLCIMTSAVRIFEISNRIE